MLDEVTPIDAAIAEKASQLRGESRSLRLPDALVLAAASEHPSVDRVISADRGWKRIGGLDCAVELITAG